MQSESSFWSQHRSLSSSITAQAGGPIYGDVDGNEVESADALAEVNPEVK